jgi:hypothetical protein
VHGVVSKVPSNYLIQLFTEADGYNSGRVYRLAAGYVCVCIYIVHTHTHAHTHTHTHIHIHIHTHTHTGQQRRGTHGCARYRQR